MFLKEGSRVVLSPEGVRTWCDPECEDPVNPENTQGTLHCLRDHIDFCYTVLWDNGSENVYRVGDLELIKPRMEENE